MSLLATILPVFALIVIGAAARRLHLLEAASLGGLTDFVFFLAMPALLLGAIADGPPFNIVGVASVYFSACLVVFAAGMLAARLLRLPLPRAAMLGLNAAYGNVVMMGIPIIAAALGRDALPPLLAIVALHSVILLPLAGVLVEMGVTGQRRPAAILRTTLRGLARNPIIMSILAAFAWRGLGVPMPAPLRERLHMLGAAAPPLALVCLGASLPAPSARAFGAEMVVGVVLKLAVLPALVWTLGLWAGLPALPLAVATLTGGLPTGANAFLLARRAQGLLEISAGTVLIATSLSLASLSVLLGLLR